MPPKLPPKKPSLKEQAKVLFAYTAENEDELSIKEGDIINIISKKVEDKGWWKGELNGKIGVFPDNFVELTKINSTTNSPNTNNTSIFKNSNSFTLNNGNSLTSNDTNEENCPKLPKKNNSETKLSSLILGRLNEIVSKSNETKSANSTLVKQESIKTNSNTSTPNLSLKSNKLSKQEASENLSNADLMIDNSESDLNSIIDDSQNSIKLKHLTASRVKGPRDRRPPSIIQLPKDDETSSINNSLNNSKELLNSSEKILSSSFDENQTNKELTKQNSKNNINEMPKQQNQVTTPTTNSQQNVPPWMIELKKTQAEKKEVKKKNFSLEDSFSLTNNSTSPNSLKSIQTPNSPTKTTNNRMSGDYSQRFKDYVHQQSISGTNSLSRHCSINSSNNFTNASRTLSTDSLDNKELQPSNLTFGNLASPVPCKPAKAIKPTAAKLMNSNNSIISNSINNSIKTNNQSKDTSISRKEFDELQKKVFELTEVVENHKQMYKNLVTDLINECAEEKKKVANLTIEVDRLRKLTTTV